MNILKKYRAKYGKKFLIAVLFLTFEAICDLLQPTIMSKIIDNGVVNKDLHYVLKLGAFMLAITAIGAISATTRNIISSNVSQEFGTNLRSDLYQKIQSLSYEQINQFNRASLVTRLTNDVTQVQVFVNGLMRIFVKAPLICLGSLLMATRLNPRLSVVLIVVVSIVAVLIYLNMKVGFPFFVKVQSALDRVNGTIREYLSGVKVIKAFHQYKKEEKKFEAANNEFQMRSIKAMRVMSIFSPSIALTVNMGIIVVIWVGGLRVNNGQMQVGQIVAYTNYMTQILFSLMMISFIFNMFVRAKASAERINEVFSQEVEVYVEKEQTKHSLSKGKIEFENVSFSYKGAVGDPVIKNFSFTCLPGQTVGIIGSTGAGKSSLIQLIPRFYDVTSGAIRVNDIDVKDWDVKELREKIAVVPQKNILFTGTVIENIRWGKEDATFEEIADASKVAEAHDFISAFPEGYETRLGQGGVNLSGGQKQRVSIARALVRKPEILILDDCTSAVDVATESRIKESLKRYAENTTCLLIAQRISSVMDADQIIVLENGEMVGYGHHEELLKSCKVYQEILQSQLGKEALQYVAGK
ncbi:ABC transporter ATP-binding protein [Bacillus sp. RG28]|uniref:ABC transporter ATP-binding protein n=1 Tax=Gottfriedia endophytica TaxID=2820819 RepID=A0A940NP40_9BACI|nr:ABC transporter ATP-binding protein [Gottfriedia endophytica]MBP0724973.1 ABC transporter ATP-binding protein [Gottfriedia endophytica]